MLNKCLQNGHCTLTGDTYQIYRWVIRSVTPLEALTESDWHCRVFVAPGQNTMETFQYKLTNINNINIHLY